MRLTLNPHYERLRSALEQLPQTFAQQGEVVYQRRNELRRMQLGGEDVVVKSFGVPIWVNRIAYTFIRKSKALRSFSYAKELNERGFVSPDPVGCIECRRGGLLERSYYVCRYDDGTEVRQLVNGEVAGREAEIDALAAVIVRMHQAGVLHQDLSPGNILIHGEGNACWFSFIDVNRMQLVGHVTKQQAAHNLRRLCRSRSVLQRLSRRYAQLRGWDEEAFAAEAERRSDAFFLHFMYRRARKRGQLSGMYRRICRFRLLRLCRQHLSPTSARYAAMLDEECRFYHQHLEPYDYRHVLTADYQ